MSDRKIIFAATARDVAPFLGGVTGNIENFATRFDQWAVLVAENDSRDISKLVLRSWMERARSLGAVRASLIEMDSLDAAHPQRTDRIAMARNRILREIEQDPVLSRFDYLAVLDLDIPNFYPLAPEKFAEAAAFLDANDDVAGVFPNQMPLYYDIWALRERNWCPRDCWEEVAVAGGGDAAIAKFIHARQIAIDPARAPIEVDSAFGGMGIYRLGAVLGRDYAGLRPDGTSVCEHVGFHESIRRDGGRLFILPGFLNLSSFEHTGILSSHAMMTIRGGSTRIFMLMARKIAAQRVQFPRFGEQFARLAGLYARGGGALLDLAPHDGVHLAQARLSGFASPYICVEESDLEFAVLCANAMMQGALFGDHRLRRADPGAGLAGQAQEAGFIRLGTGSDASLLLAGKDHLGHQPVLWARMEEPEETTAWEKALAVLPYDTVAVFNSLGMLIASGPLTEQKEKLTSLFGRLPRSGGGFDLVFFGEKTRDLFEGFRGGTDSTDS